MRMSVISASGCSRCSAASAVSACSKDTGCMPPWHSARSSTQRMEASTSTSQTSSGFDVFCSMESQQDRAGGQTGGALELDQPVVATDQVLRDGEAEPGAARAPGDERIEQGHSQVLGYAGAVVLELHAGDQAMARRPDAHVRQRPRAQY